MYKRLHKFIFLFLVLQIAFLFFGEKKGVMDKEQNKSWKVRSGQTIVHLNSLNIAAWIVKPLNAGCVNTGLQAEYRLNLIA